jgi:mRNA interferase RelE/StbE
VYRLDVTKRAQRELDKLGDDVFERVAAAIRNLREDPRQRGSRKLKGPIYRIRVGGWRIIYAVFDKDRLIIVGKVSRRSERTYDKIDELF